MNPGELRHRITIEKPAEEQDERGAPIEEWINVATVWASVNPFVGKEYFAAEKINNEVSHKIKIRYRTGITSNMRVKFKDRYFNIISVINYQERNIELQLMCKELL